jgi:DNA invertase Pin-like site-specific DNA recombinase
MVGYGRVSSVGQNIETQRDQLKAAGCKKVFLEKKTGTTTEGREQLALALDYVREGDVFVVTRLDRLARSTTDLLAIIKALADKGVAFKCTEQDVSTSGAMGKLTLTILAAFAEFENGIRKERQMDGIARAKAEDKERKAQGLDAETYRGRPATIDPAEVARLKADGLGASAIAKRLKIGRASVYRVLEAPPAA